MPETTTEAVPQKLTFAAPAPRDVAAWRARLRLDRGPRIGWTLSREVRSRPTSDHSPRLFGANAEVWKRLMLVHGDSAVLVDARREQARADHGAAVDELIAWLDSEDFGADPNRMRREAWR